MSSSPPARSRAELITAIFQCCDQDGNGRLHKQELHRFAKHSGFDGDSQAWAEEFRNLCREARADESVGLRLDMFQALINDSTEKGCYCTDSELRAMLEALESEECQGAAPGAAGLGDGKADPVACLATSPTRAAATATAVTPTLSRGVQLRAIFQLCDRDGDGYLSQREMRIFAGYTGFRGSDAEWEEEYRLLCREIDATPARGLDVLQLERLTNDASNSGCYCHDGELCEIRSQLELEVRRTRLGESPVGAPPPPSRLARPELIQRVFRVCDSNRDGFLSSAEMKRFAVRTGFDGTEDAWNAEYKFLCADNGVDPQLGIGVDLLERLINDRTDNGCFCNDEELRAMLTQWATEEKERHEATVAEPRPGPPEPHPRPREPGEASVRSSTETRAANKIRQDSPPRTRPSPLRSPSTETPGEPTPASERRRLVAALFKSCDADGDLLLKEQDMRRFASITGFDGSDKDWSMEYHALCRDRGLESTSGLNLAQFEELVDDESERGCYFSSKDLAVILKRLDDEAAAGMAEGKHRRSVVATTPDSRQTEEELLAARPELPTGTMAQQAFVPGTRAADARHSLACAVFNHCDRDGDGRLNARELFDFASQTGFDGSTENWAQEYRSLCTEAKVDPDAGITLDVFWALVNDPSEKGCYCTDAELQQASEAFGQGAARPGPAVPLSPGQAASEEQGLVPDLTRTALLRDLFRLCDHNGDGFLDNQEMRLFAAHTGFKGSDTDWEKEFRLACIEVGAEPARGPNAQQFGQLANSGNGATCSDVELRSIRLSLQAKATQHHLNGGLATSKAEQASSTPNPHDALSTRSELVDAVFRACDKDGDGCLSMSEMYRFALQTGFDGCQEQWAGEYDLLCSDNGIPAQPGVKPELLRKLVDDHTVMGCFCDDTELQRMLALWEREDKRRPETPTTEARASPPEPHSAPPASFHELKMTNKIRQDAPPTDPRPLAQPEQPAAKLQAETAPAKQSARTALALKLFDALDADGDRHLNREEMRRFACLTGFEGNQEDWSREHHMLCADRGVNPVVGLTAAQFEELVDDKTERGCYFSDEELGLILTRLDEADQVKLPMTTLASSASARADSTRAVEPRPVPKAATAGPRPDPHLELIDAVFRLCDRDCDKRLNSKEMHCIAMHTAFDGTDEQWAQEYRLLCEEHNEDPAVGIPREVLRKLLNDCSDVELRDMVLKVAAGPIPGATEPTRGDAGTSPTEQSPSPARSSLPWGAQCVPRQRTQQPLVGIGGSVGPRQLPLAVMEPPRIALAQQPAPAATPQSTDTSNAGGTTSASARQQPRAAAGNAAAAAAEHLTRAPSLPPATSTPWRAEGSSPESLSRAELVRAVFHECDVDGNGRLSEQEMFVFARLTEYEGSKAQWGVEYQSLCVDNGVDPKAGVDLPLFEKLVDDTSPSGIHCTDLELRSMLSVLATACKAAPNLR